MTALALLAAASMASAQLDQSPHTQVRLVSETSVFVAGQPFQAALVLDVEPMWHIYWSNPGDSGQAPDVQWRLPKGWKAGQLSHPAPYRHLAGGFASYIHEGKVVLPFTLTPPVDASVKADLSGTVTWLVCKEECLPGRTEVNLVVRRAAKPVRTGATRAIADAMANLPTTIKGQLSWIQGQPTVRVQGLPEADRYDIFPGQPATIDHTNPVLHFGREGSVAVLGLRRSDYLTGEPKTIAFLAVPMDGTGKRTGPGVTVSASVE